MTQVLGSDILSKTWIFGYAVFFWAYGMCNIITMLASFFSALFFMDWMTTYDKWEVKCWDWIYAYYWAQTYLPYWLYALISLNIKTTHKYCLISNRFFSLPLFSHLSCENLSFPINFTSSSKRIFGYIEGLGATMYVH